MAMGLQIDVLLYFRVDPREKMLDTAKAGYCKGHRARAGANSSHAFFRLISSRARDCHASSS